MYLPGKYQPITERQIQQMLKQGVITESSSPWMAPAVFVPKKSGELHICIDYCQLNKQTVKDAYPLPLPDEVQDKLAGCTVFRTLNLHSGYWQLPVAPHDQHSVLVQAWVYINSAVCLWSHRCPRVLPMFNGLSTKRSTFRHDIPR